MRILINGNTEITKETYRIDSEVYQLNYDAGDSIIIASDFPFNHLFIKLGTVKNIIPANMTVSYYAQGGWTQVVDLIDETNGLEQSGYIEFTPNKNVFWKICDSDEIAGISTVIYEKYWTKIEFDATLTEYVDLSFVGYKFCDDSDLYSEYPIFDDNTMRTVYKSGKTDWEEQEIKASSLIVLDLQKKGIILAPEQILDRKKFIGAAVCKTAEIIYSAFGNDYVNQKKDARIEYDNRLNLSQYNVDLNNDGILNQSEKVYRQQWLTR